MVELYGQANKILKPSAHMRNSMNGGIWETQASQPAKQYGQDNLSSARMAAVGAGSIERNQSFIKETGATIPISPQAKANIIVKD